MSSVNEDLLQRVGGSNLVDWHRSNGKDTEALDYLERYRGVLRSGLSGTQKLYLDTNYWVWMRDAELGRGTPEANRLLQTLRAMVRSREVLCVSYVYSFLEIGRQDEKCLRVSAQLLDELTESVVIASPNDLLDWECAEYVRLKLGLNFQENLSLWTKLGQIHTHKLPVQMAGSLTSADTNVILKSLIDVQWNTNFEDIFERFNWDTKSRLDASIEPHVLTQVEARKKEQNAKGLSREQVRRNEFSQVLSSQLRPIFTKMFCAALQQHQSSESHSAALRQVQTILDAAMNEFNAGTLGPWLPSMAIPVELYTLYETNYRKSTPITSNDYIDWTHAAAALAYCDMFFTERHLAHQLRQELKADRQYNCEVVGTLEEALNSLQDKKK